MLTPFQTPRLLLTLLAASASLLSRPSAAQSPVAPHGYEFMTVITDQGAAGGGASARITSKMIFMPAFQNREELLLKPLPRFTFRLRYNQPTYRENVALINQQLGEITAAGWELVSIMPPTTLDPDTSHEEIRYLFRKPRP